jgi:type IV secretory pathway TrbL component
MEKGERWKILHKLIIINFALQILYGFYMVFFVIGGGKYPLFKRAIYTPLEIIVKRRLYSIEVWIAIMGLSIYLAITEILPKIMNKK